MQDDSHFVSSYFSCASWARHYKTVLFVRTLSHEARGAPVNPIAPRAAWTNTCAPVVDTRPRKLALAIDRFETFRNAR
jgi:hypothetical protein